MVPVRSQRGMHFYRVNRYTHFEKWASTLNSERRNEMAERVSAGVLALAKPGGMTSRDAVNVVQRLVRPLKVGHAGTLDPLATGVLVVCLGGATRLVPWIQDGRKHYRAVFRLGLTSDTDDITGNVVTAGDAAAIARTDVEAALGVFIGCIEQVPPQFSAVHVQGQRAYDLARRGETVELVAKTIEVESITLIEWNPPDFTVEILCGSGTYVRSIGRDLGQRLGCGAVMTALTRLAVGPFSLENCAQLDELDRDTLLSHVHPPASAVAHLPTIALSVADVVKLRQGQRCPIGAEVTAVFGQDHAAVDAQNDLIGIITPTDDHPPRWTSRMMMPFTMNSDE